MSDNRNIKLRAAREATPSRTCPGMGMPRTELAERVRAHIWQHHGIRAGVDRKYIARLEAGGVSWPGDRYRAALRDILNVNSDSELGFSPARLIRATAPVTAELHLPWTLDGAIDAITAVSEDPMDRRTFLSLSSTSLAELAFAWLVALPAQPAERTTGRQVDHAQVDALDLITDDLRLMDDRLGGGAVIDLARGQVQVVARLLRDGRYDESVGRRLHGSAAELLRFAGWTFWDMQNYPAAQRYWSGALRAAHAAGDDQIGANTMAYMAVQVLETGNYVDALNLTSAARLRLHASPKAAAIVHLCHAEAAGVAREERECRKAIDDAHHSLNAPGASPAWAYWADLNFHEMAGYALLRLGDLDAATTHLTAHVGSIEPGRELARGHAHLARAYAESGEPEQAAATGLQAVALLEDDVVSPRSILHLHHVREALAPYSVPEADEFRERLALLT